MIFFDASYTIRLSMRENVLLVIPQTNKYLESAVDRREPMFFVTKTAILQPAMFYSSTDGNEFPGERE